APPPQHAEIRGDATGHPGPRRRPAVPDRPFGRDHHWPPGQLRLRTRRWAPHPTPGGALPPGELRAAVVPGRLDTTRQDWRTFRVDRIRTRPSERARYQSRSLPEGDAAAYVQDAISRSPYRDDFTVRLFAPAAEVSGWVSAAAGEVIDEGEGRTILRTGWDDFDEFLGYLFSLDVPFEFLAPESAIRRVRT